MPVVLHRDRELAIVRESLACLAEGRPAIVVIEGERGIGKSALLRSAVAGVDGLVLRARCHSTERGFAYGVLGQLFDRFSGTETQPLAGRDNGPVDGRPEHDRLDKYYRLTRSAAAARPVVIAIDDAHLADGVSARWCSYVARRLDDLPAALVMTVGPGGGAAELVSDLAGLTHSRVIRLGPLCVGCAGRLIAARTGTDDGLDDDLIRRCHALTRGNPQVLTALVDRLGRADQAQPVDGDPERVVAMAAGVLAATGLDWLRQDDPVKADLVEQFAVCRTGTLDTAAMLIGQGEEIARTVRATMRRIGLLAGQAPDRFVHPAAREAIVDRLRLQTRAELHKRAASVLSRMGEEATLTAEHVMSVGSIGEDWVRPVLRQAVREAAAAGDWSRAARYLNRALIEPGTVAQILAVTAELGAVQVHNELSSCPRRLSSAADLAGSDPALLGSLVDFADATLTLEDADAVGVFQHAAAAIAAGGRINRGALLRLTAQTLLGPPGHASEVRAAMRQLPHGPDDLAARQLRSALALTAAARGRNRRRCRSLALLAAGGGPARVMEPVPSTIACAALALVWAGELGPAADAAAQAVEAARLMSSATGEALALLICSEVAHMQGNLDAALTDARRAVELCRVASAPNLCSAAVANLNRILLVRGEIDQVPVVATVHGPETGGHPYLHALRLEARGMAAAAHGNQSQALRLYLETGRHLVAGGLVNPACSAWRSRAVASLLRLGRSWEARTLAEGELDLARRWGAPGPLGRSLVSAAMAYDGERRSELLTEAVGLLENSECRLELARAVVRNGTTQLQAGHAGARDTLERGLALANACSAGALAAIARQALHAAGVRPREHGTTGELTVAERRVAELVMRGMSNQAVAATLTLSKRTVDTHLGRIYRKLGIAGRSRLREALARADG